MQTMVDQPSREQLRWELRRRGLPRAYIERLLAELDDHFADLLEERNPSMSAARKLQFEQDIEQDDLQQRLGSPTQLAIFAAEQYHARSFWGRHPWVTFVVAPLPLLVAFLATYGLVLTLAMKGISFVAENVFGWSFAPHEHPWFQGITVGILIWGLIVLPPLAAAWLLCRVAQRNALSWRWPAVACALLAFVVAASAVSYRLATVPNNGMLAVGFGFNASADWLLLTFLPKFALALGIGLLLVKRAQQKLELETMS
jgi:hypothetical protein